MSVRSGPAACLRATAYFRPTPDARASCPDFHKAVIPGMGQFEAATFDLEILSERRSIGSSVRLIGTNQEPMHGRSNPA